MKTGWRQDHHTEIDAEKFLGWCQGQGIGHIRGYGTVKAARLSEGVVDAKSTLKM